MARPPEPPSPLVLAAQELEDEIRRCEKTVEEASRLRLNSEKNIGRATQALKTASEDRERMAVKVGALLAAINAGRARMEEVTSRMQARAAELQERVARLEKLQEGTAEIGAMVREVNAFAGQVKDSRQILERLLAVEERIGKAIEEARAEGFDDVTRDVAAMRDMLRSLRNKLESR